jgi:hypothetical protein
VVPELEDICLRAISAATAGNLRERLKPNKAEELAEQSGWISRKLVACATLKRNMVASAWWLFFCRGQK